MIGAWWRILFIVGALMALALPSTARHGVWHEHYTDAYNVSCCGVADCRQTVGRLLSRDSTNDSAMVTLEAEGVLIHLPAASVHGSEDGQFWLCVRRQGGMAVPLTSAQVRCAFVAVGG